MHEFTKGVISGIKKGRSDFDRQWGGKSCFSSECDPGNEQRLAFTNGMNQREDIDECNEETDLHKNRSAGGRHR